MPIVEGPRPQPLRIMEDRADTGGMSLNDSVYDRLLRERIIFLGQPVDDKIANQICAQLLLLSAEDSARDINLYINSPGGSVTAGMAIFDTIELIECDVATWAMGLAASMGQFLLSAGTKDQLSPQWEKANVAMASALGPRTLTETAALTAGRT